MRTIAFLLLLAATPALSEIRSDQAVAPVVYGVAPLRQEYARVASDGENFFVVWRTRTASNTVVIGGGRISPAGALLDPLSILFASGSAATIGNPDVIFVGGDFLVAWQSGTSVFTRRIARHGRPVDAQPFAIDNAAMVAPLATNGKNVFLATARNRFRLLGPDGTPLGPERDIPNAGSGAMSVTSNGDRYLIAYAPAGGAQTRGLFLLLSGAGDFEVRKEISFASGTPARAITAASNGSSFLLVSESAYMTVDADGKAGEPRYFAGAGAAVTATWSGSEYTLAWPRTVVTFYVEIPHEIVGLRVDADGVQLDGTPVKIASLPNDRYGAVLGAGWNGKDTILVTGDSDANFKDWHTTAAIFKSLPQIDAEPAARRHAAIASSAAEQASGSIASNGTLSLVAWRESTGVDRAVVRAAFIAPDGQLGASIDLGAAHPHTTTATVSNGRDFLVAYFETPQRLLAQRVTLEGVLDPTPIVITNYGHETEAVAVGWSGRAYVVVTAGYGLATISGMNASGIVTVPRQPFNYSTTPDTPAVSCDANGCDVAWHEPFSPCYTLCSDFGENDVLTRTDADGIVVSQVVVSDVRAITPARSLRDADGKSTFVYSQGKTMFAGRLSAGGLVLDPLVLGAILTSETSFPLQPVSWLYNGLYFVEPDSSTNGRLYWTRIEPEPAPHVTSLVNLHESVTLPVTLTASARNTYLVYSRGEDDATLMAPRLFLRTLASPDPQTSPVRKRATR